MIGYVWNKKAKSHKINYEKHNEQINYNVIKVGVDNDMHIPGYTRMYQHVLHCKWTLHQYFAHKKLSMRNTYELSNKRWQSMAKVEAIIRSRPSFDDLRPIIHDANRLVAHCRRQLAQCRQDQDYHQADDLLGHQRRVVILF